MCFRRLWCELTRCARVCTGGGGVWARHPRASASGEGRESRRRARHQVFGVVQSQFEDPVRHAQGASWVCVARIGDFMICWLEARGTAAVVPRPSVNVLNCCSLPCEDLHSSHALASPSRLAFQNQRFLTRSTFFSIKRMVPRRRWHGTKTLLRHAPLRHLKKLWARSARWATSGAAWRFLIKSTSLTPIPTRGTPFWKHF